MAALLAATLAAPPAPQAGAAPASMSMVLAEVRVACAPAQAVSKNTNGTRTIRICNPTQGFEFYQLGCALSAGSQSRSIIDCGGNARLGLLCPLRHRTGMTSDEQASRPMRRR